MQINCPTVPRKKGRSVAKKLPVLPDIPMAIRLRNDFARPNAQLLSKYMYTVIRTALFPQTCNAGSACLRQLRRTHSIYLRILQLLRFALDKGNTQPPLIMILYDGNVVDVGAHPVSLHIPAGLIVLSLVSHCGVSYVSL